MEDYAWLPLERVLRFLSIPPGSDKVAAVEDARQAGADEVEHLRPDLIGAQGFTAPPRVVQGAVMWAARLYVRRNSPSGLVSFGEFGAVSSPSFDADAERLLGIGRYATPRVG